MMRLKKLSIALGMTAVVLLTACGQQSSVAKPQYEQADVVAVIKGNVHGTKHVTYTTDTAKGNVKVDNGRFRIAVPTATHGQTITMKVKGQTVKRHIKAVRALGAYRQVADKYNQALAVTALPQPVQAQLKSMANVKARAATMPPTQQLAMMQAEAKLKQAMVQAEQATKARQLPATVSGQRQVLKTATSSMHLNVQGGQLMSVTIALTPTALKSADAQQQVGLQLGLLATALGANAQQVGQQFQQLLKGGSLKDQTITDQGIKFHVGTTLTAAYLFVTR